VFGHHGIVGQYARSVVYVLDGHLIGPAMRACDHTTMMSEIA
jgi:hypothetical protein